MIKKLLHIKKIRKICLKFFIWLDNLCYKIISQLVILDNNGLHPKHQILNYHQFFVDHIEPTDVIIDIGCGNGANAYDIAAKARRVVGIDISAKNIEKAQNGFKRQNLTYIQGDATTYPFTERYNKIVLSNVLEHIEYRVEFLKKLHRISDIVLLRVPMIDRDWLAVYKKENGFEYRLDPTHYIEYTLDILKKELSEGGWDIESYSIQFGELWGVVKSVL